MFKKYHVKVTGNYYSFFAELGDYDVSYFKDCLGWELICCLLSVYSYIF